MEFGDGFLRFDYVPLSVMQEELRSVRENIAAFRRKYYINLALRGSLLTASLLGGYFLLATLIEYVAWLSPLFRFLLFSLFFVLSAFSIFYFLRSPLLWWLSGVGLSEEEAAQLIGKKFPEVNDRLLNILQLARIGSSNDLAAAGISQKSFVVQKYSFASAINLNVNKSYAKYFVLALLVFLALLIFNKSILTESTDRIIHFNQEYTPAAPFSFNLPPQDLRAYFNENHTLHLNLSGSAVPEAAYLILPNQRIKMEGSGENFSHTFEKLQQPVSFQVEAAGYFSPSYKIEILHRPELLRMNMVFYFPAYLHQPSALQSNAGAITIPEGTRVGWNIETQNTSKAFISFGGMPSPLRTSNHLFYTFEKSFKDPSHYSISLFNDDSQLKDSVSYPITVIKDAHPQIVVKTQADSVLFKNIFLGGAISDDYANSKLELIYTVASTNGKAGEEKKKPIPIFSNRRQQNFVYQWNLDSLGLKPNQQINYFLQVWDNDGVNGPKATRSASYSFNVPSAEEMKNSITQSENATKSAFEKSIEKTRNIREAVKAAEEKIRTKRQLDWQDKKALEDLVKQKQELDQQVQELQKQNELLEQKKADDIENKRIKEKAEQLQKLMQELLDDKTKELFKKLEELLQKNADPKSIQEVLKKLDNKEINLEKELERTMELFKQLQRDFKFEQTTNDLRENIKKQKDLMEETEKSEKGQSEKTESELSKEQEKVKEDFKDFEKSLDELKKMDEHQALPKKENTDNVEKSMENSKKELENKKSGKSKQHQKEAVQKMEMMETEMREAQESMEMEMDEKNMESLKQILHGLIKLSFDQESLAKDFGKVEQSDPNYLKLSERQLDLKNDIEVLEDSLISIAKKDAFMSAVVSRKVGDLNEHFDRAIHQIKERNQAMATSEMQSSMAAINDLALLLNEHFDRMMKMMANPSGGKGKKGKGKTPSLSQLQKKLNEQIEQLQKNGKTPGRQLSEELAKMAAEQERIRHALEKMQEKLLKNGGKMPGGDIPSKMEQTELDLVNKKLTEETVLRQREIMTRLLETENSIRERDEDQERKGETAKKYNAVIPKSFEEYFKLKEKEIELIRTLPPKLQPFYKNEVNKYFERLGNK